MVKNVHSFYFRFYLRNQLRILIQIFIKYFQQGNDFIDNNSLNSVVPVTNTKALSALEKLTSYCEINSIDCNIIFFNCFKLKFIEEQSHIENR